MASLLRKIVHNEAMAHDPPEIYGWRVFLLAAASCFGAMSFGWDSGVIGGVITLDPFIRDYGLGHEGSLAEANLSGNIVVVLLVGALVGALVTYPIADRWGRRPTLLGAAVLTAVGVIMQAAALGRLGTLYAGRLISGLGVGACSCVTPFYVSENAPRAIRGLLTGTYQIMLVTGTMLAFWINYAADLHLSGPSQYIVPLAVQAIPAVLLFGLMLFCPESARWLARQGRWEEAGRVLGRLRGLGEGSDYVREELGEIREGVEWERRVMGEGTGFLALQREMWTVPTNRRRALLSVGLMICQQMTGTNAVNTYTPTIFGALGVGGRSSALLSTGVYGVVKVVACAAFLLFLADSAGRRKSLLVSSTGLAVCMFYMGLYLRISPPPSSGSEGSPAPAGYVALVAIYVFAAFFQFGWGPACWIVVSEIPSARLRAVNVALAAATQWLFNLVVSKALPVMLVTTGEGGYGTFLIFGSFCVLMWFFVFVCVPETKGVALEHMDELFGGVSEAAKHDAVVAAAAKDHDDHGKDSSTVDKDGLPALAEQVSSTGSGARV